MAWTKEQQAAIDSRGQTLLLSAAAGSGKTAVLVERIIQRLLDTVHPIDITELLVVTFTKAAASEMRERIAAALGAALGTYDEETVGRQLALLPSASISTLHSFCQDVIRRYFYTIDLDPAFVIAGEEELGLLRKQVLEDVFLSYYDNEDKAVFLYPLADMFGNDRGDDALMETVSQMYDYSRSMPWPQDWLERAAQAYDIDENASIDDMAWVQPVKEEIRRILQGHIQAYRSIMTQLQQRPSFSSAYEAFAIELGDMEHAMQRQSWDSLQKAVMAITFPRLKAMRGLDEEEKNFWQQCKDIRNACKKEITESVQAVYFSLHADEWLQGIRDMSPMIHGLVALTNDFASAYSNAKKEKGWIDFSDLEHFCLHILLDATSTPDHPVPSAAARELRDTYAEVMIDEYQDTNGVQELITRLVSHEDNRFMVGDIKQSIYRFRLADPTLFLQKYQTYSRDEHAVERCIDLAKNFRSVPLILHAVNEVFSRAMTMEATGMTYGDRERLYDGRTTPNDEAWVGGPVEIHLVNTKESEDEEEQEADLTAFEKECQVIASRIQTLKNSHVLAAKKDGTMELLTYRHIVILMRSLSGKAETLLQTLQAAGIPAYAEQSGGYFAAIEVQVMLALLQCIDNPEQDLAMAAILRSPLVGMSEETLSLLRLSKDTTLWQAIPSFVETMHTADEAKKLQQFYEQLNTWRTYSRRHSVAELLQCLYQETGYYDYVGGMPSGAVRQANLQALYDRAGQYEKAGFHGVFRYLRFIQTMQKNGVDLAPAKVLSEREDVVRIMSIHKSKGLEFPVVIAADMGKGFNRKDMQSLLLFHHTLGIGLKQFDATWRMTYPTMIWKGISSRLAWESTAEEERILYVAMTRARDKLILTGHTSHMDTDWQRWNHQLEPVQAKSYLDWIMPCICRQTQGVDVETSLAVRKTLQWQCGLWDIYIWQHVSEPPISEEVLQAEPRLMKLQQGVETQTAIPAWMDEQLSWQYAFPKAVTTAAKFSVSEIKRQYGLLHDEIVEEEQQLAATVDIQPEDEDIFAQLPPWMAVEEEKVTGAQRGTALHKVMQYITIHPHMNAKEIRRQLAQWEAEGVMTNEETQLVYIPAILQFCQSPLGQRMANATDIRREYPFSVIFPGGGYLPDVEKGEGMLVQGVIDCLFCDDQGWVLVDYKTDRLETEEAFRQRYTVQLALYRQAVEQMSPIVLQHICIYSFYLQKEIVFA